MPIKQFKRIKGSLFEKKYILGKDLKINQVFRKASVNNNKIIRSYKTLKKLNFIEFPKLGFREFKDNERLPNKWMYFII